MAFRASSSRINTQRQPSLREELDDVAQLGPLHVQRRRPQAQRVKRAGSSGRFERKGHYEACGIVKLLLAFPQAAAVKPLEQAFLAEVCLARRAIFVHCSLLYSFVESYKQSWLFKDVMLEQQHNSQIWHCF